MIRKSSERLVPPPEMREAVEQKKKYREVVRVFMSQAKLSEDVMAQFSSEKKRGFSGLFFTKTLWAEKNAESKNPGQRMPVGGKIDPGETPEKAAAREMLEETHLRPVSMEKLSDESIQYTLTTPKEKKIPIRQQFYYAEVPPTDIPYPIDPEEDKIADFSQFDIGNLRHLISPDEQIDGVVSSSDLLGSLRINAPGIEADVAIEFDQNSALPQDIFFSLEKQLWQAEIKKRLSVITEFIYFLDENLDDVKQEFPNLFAVEEYFGITKNKDGSETFDISSHQKDFEKFWDKYSKIDDAEYVLAKAIDASNFEEEVTEKEKESELEAQIRFLYTLVETHHSHNKYLDIAERNPNLASLVTDIRQFIAGISSNAEHSDVRSRSMSDVLHELDDFDDELVAELCKEAFLGNKTDADISKGLKYVNNFLGDVVNKAIRPVAKGLTASDAVAQFTEIKNADLATLARYAFGHNNTVDIEKYSVGSSEDTNALRKRFIFEARRKLFFLIEFAHVDQYYDTVTERGVKPIEQLWGNIMTAPLYDVYTKDISDSSDGLQEIDILNSDERGGLQHKLRKIGKDDTAFLASVHAREKTRPSLYRKCIIRPGEPVEKVHDIYGRSLTIAPQEENKEYVTQIDTREISIEDKTRKCTDNVPVLDILEKFSSMPGVTILQYKPTPQEGQSFKSDGPGGGGDIRFAKFYIQFDKEQENGERVSYYEEVQIFSPDKDHSAFYFHDKKKEDDSTYFLDRLLDTKSLRSFVELLFPTSLYGKPIHHMRVDQNERQRNKKNGNGNGSEK
jgi:8-oxo-dGTP pyrophosphatase MutT (NUDIX family)